MKINKIKINSYGKLKEKQIILDKADIIKLNNLHEKYNDDEIIKKELLIEIKDIASYYGLDSIN